MPDLNGKCLKDVFLMNEFQQEINELSAYCANIKQEKPIIYLLAKYLWKAGFTVALEYPVKDKKGKTIGKTDLLVNGKRIEAKYYYESDLAQEGFEEPIKNMIKKIESKSYTTWNVPIPIVKDMLTRNTDIFILIIQSRNLLNIEKDKLERICWSKPELKYNENNGKNNGYNNEEYLNKLKPFLKQIHEEKPFKQESFEIHADFIIPSTYHICICDFTDNM